MRSVTATRSKPFSRNSRAAVSTTRALFSATFSFVSRMPAVRPHCVDFDDIRHQTIMTYIINIPVGRTLQDVWAPGREWSSGHGGAGFGGYVVAAGHPLRVGDRRGDLLDQPDDGRGDGPAGRADPAAVEGIRLGHRGDFECHCDSPGVVRFDGAH